MSKQPRLTDPTRLRDLVRYARHQLHQDGLITNEEYAALLIEHGGVQRLETYDELRAENDRLLKWVADLQSGMFINCVYCGHRYGPDPGTPVAMADILKAHVGVCSEHPMSKLKNDLVVLLAELGELTEPGSRRAELLDRMRRRWGCP